MKQTTPYKFSETLSLIHPRNFFWIEFSQCTDEQLLFIHHLLSCRYTCKLHQTVPGFFLRESQCRAIHQKVVCQLKQKKSIKIFFPNTPIFACQNFDHSWSWLSFVGGNREQWYAVTRKREKATHIFAYILLASNHTIFLA